MSVLIKGIEMPNPGQIVLVEIDENGDVFAAYDGGRTKLAQYKAVPVPPHGRLIDAEPIMKYIADGLNSGEFGYDQIKVLAEIQYAPTIIPADKEADNA